jgi:hypothetical protein
MPPRARDVEPDFEAFCACLNRHHVEYLIVGSEAVAVHGAPRYSQDFDAFVRATRENAKRLVAALEDFGFGDPARQLDVDGWLARGQALELGRPPNQIHVLTTISGVTFDEALEDHVSATYGTVPVRYIGIKALLRNKLAAARPKDLADVAALQAGRRPSGPTRPQG